MKAILVINMPPSCNKCKLKTTRFAFITEKLMVGCKFVGDRLTEANGERPSWCPLKYIPDKACKILMDGLDAMDKMKAVEVKVIRRTE